MEELIKKLLGIEGAKELAEGIQKEYEGLLGKISDKNKEAQGRRESEEKLNATLSALMEKLNAKRE